MTMNQQMVNAKAYFALPICMILVWLKCLPYLHVSHVPEMVSLVGFSQALRGFYLHP